MSSADTPQDLGQAAVQEYFRRSSEALAGCINLADSILALSDQMVGTLKRGGTIFWCGNGGSASDAEHLAAELVGRFARDRPPLRSVALTSNSSVTLALGNDYGFDEIFARQLSAIGRSGDLLVGISTSGQSNNVIRAVATARAMGIWTAGLTGNALSPLGDLCDLAIRVPSSTTCHVQECHIAVGQLVCGLVEDKLFPATPHVGVDSALSFTPLTEQDER